MSGMNANSIEDHGTLNAILQAMQSQTDQLSAQNRASSDKLLAEQQQFRTDVTAQLAALEKQWDQKLQNIDSKVTNLDERVESRMRSVEDDMKQLRKEMENKWETGSSFTAASGSTQNLDVKFVPRRVMVKGWAPHGTPRANHMPKASAQQLGEKILAVVNGTTLKDKVVFQQPQLMNWQVVFVVQSGGLLECTQLKQIINTAKDTGAFDSISKFDKSTCFAAMEQSPARKASVKSWWAIKNSLVEWIRLDDEWLPTRLQWDDVARSLLDKTSFDVVGRFVNRTNTRTWELDKDAFQNKYRRDPSTWNAPMQP